LQAETRHKALRILSFGTPIWVIHGLFVAGNVLLVCTNFALGVYQQTNKV